MRQLLLAASLLLLLLAAPSASAARCPPMCVGANVEPTLPSDGCSTCVGVAASAGVKAPDGCVDCTTLGAGVEVSTDGDSVHVEAFLCRGGFIYICPVDVSEDVPL